MFGISALHFDLEQKLKIYHTYNDIKFIEYGVDGIKDIEILNTFMSKPENKNVKIAIHLPLKSNSVEDVEYLRDANIQFVSEIIREILQFEPLYFNLHLGHVFFSKYKSHSKRYLDMAGEYLNELLDISSKVNLYIENVYSFSNKESGDLISIGTISKEFEYILKMNKNNRLGFCYDLGHAILQNENYDKILSLKKLLYHFNINDGSGDQHLGVQENGKYTKKFFYESLKKHDFNYVVLELDTNEILKTLDILNII